MKKRTDRVLAEGEVTGHAHVVDRGCVYDLENGERLLEAPEGANLTHEEHGPQTIAPGVYDRKIVQEFDPWAEEVRDVRD